MYKEIGVGTPFSLATPLGIQREASLVFLRFCISSHFVLNFITEGPREGKYQTVLLYVEFHTK